ncbi:MAG: hypothetical protein ACRCW6_03010 [Mycoplasmoidaceae bacterium]
MEFPSQLKKKPKELKLSFFHHQLGLIILEFFEKNSTPGSLYVIQLIKNNIKNIKITVTNIFKYDFHFNFPKNQNTWTINNVINCHEKPNGTNETNINKKKDIILILGLILFKKLFLFINSVIIVFTYIISKI